MPTMDRPQHDGSPAPALQPADELGPVPSGESGHRCFEPGHRLEDGAGYLTTPMNEPCDIDWHVHLVTHEEYERVVGMAGRHDPTGADHMEEMWVHAQRADVAEAVARRLLYGWTPGYSGALADFRIGADEPANCWFRGEHPHGGVPIEHEMMTEAEAVLLSALSGGDDAARASS